MVPLSSTPGEVNILTCEFWAGPFTHSRLELSFCVGWPGCVWCLLGLGGVCMRHFKVALQWCCIGRLCLCVSEVPQSGFFLWRGSWCCLSSLSFLYICLFSSATACCASCCWASSCSHSCFSVVFCCSLGWGPVVA